MAQQEYWVGTWAAAPAPAEGVAVNNVTLRMNARISLGGKVIRLRLSNAHGTRPLTIGAAHVGLRAAGPAVRPETNRALTFGGASGATIAAGSLLISDPVELAVPPLADAVITIHLPDDLSAGFGITGRYARQTNYISPLGNFAADAVMPVGRITDDWYFVSGIDVLADPGTGGVVALGDSLTDGNISTHDMFASWPGQLARRLTAAGRSFGVMNQGLGGNRILHDIRGDSGLRRFDRDVLAAPGVSHAIVLLGTNDLRNRWRKPEEEANASAMIAGLKQMAVRAHAKGIKLFGGAIPPFENETFLPGAWNPAREAVRQSVNAWIRETDVFDAVIDFDLGLRNPEHLSSLLPRYDCGDHLHPSDEGYHRMGDIIDLALFD